MTSSTSTLRWLRPLLLSAASGILLVGIWRYFVVSAHGQILDTLGYNGSDIGSWLVSGHLDNLLSHITVLRLAVATLAVGLVAALRRRWLLALEAMAVVLGANLSTQVLKYKLFTRPDLFHWGQLTSNTYPSGHTTVASSLVVAFLLVTPARLRSASAVVGSLLMALFGYATLAAHWHRPVDAIGGFLVCFCWAFMALFVTALRHRFLGRGRAELPDLRRPSRVVPALLVGAGGVALAVALACLLMSWDVTEVWHASRHEYFVAYLGSSAGIVGIAVTGMGVLLRIVQLHDASAAQLA